MTKKQRIIHETKLAMGNQALGAGRTTKLEAIAARYNLAADLNSLRTRCLYTGADYWTVNRGNANG